METGAVKQAYNNEVILLKKNLNQAKIQIIHKLTRKAKQFTERKGPEAIREKFKRKAEAAVKEVLIIKKVKARDIGKFIITHKGKLEDYLKKPEADNEKACARILLHKSMQEKYKFIRTRFMNVPIKDLFMSRQERLKLKKEEREKKKEKRDKKLKNKSNVVNAEGDWNVEDVNIKTEIKNSKNKKVNSDDKADDDQNVSDAESADIRQVLDKNNENSDEEGQSSEEKKGSDEEQDISDEGQEVSDEDNDGESMQSDGESVQSDGENAMDSANEGFESGSDIDTVGEGFKISFKGQSDQESGEDMDQDGNSSDDFANVVKAAFLKSKESKSLVPPLKELKEPVKKTKASKNSLIEKELPPSIELKIKSIQQKKEASNKNKKLNDKIINKKFKKGSVDGPALEKKVVDPFFVTESGENYLSIAEPRAPDEFKEEHRQGNRKIRRAAMFGHVPKIKPRKDFRQDNNRYGKQNGSGRNANSSFDSRNNVQDKFQREDKFNNKKQRFNDSNEKFNDKRNQDEKPEKLHPSWEAKKKLSSILPFQGKKIVFDES